MFCSQCGTQMPDNAAICPNCGANVQSAPVQNHTAAEPAPDMNQMQPGQAAAGAPVQPGQGYAGAQMQPGQGYAGAPVQPGQGYAGAQMQPGQGYAGAPVYNGQPAPQPNPLAFLTAAHPGVPFPLKSAFSGRNLVSTITTIDLIGVIGAIIAFICVFLPFLSIEGESISIISSEMREAGMKLGWLVIVLSIAMAVLYFLRMEMLAFLAALLNLLTFIHVWTFGGTMKSLYTLGSSFFSDSKMHYGVGFYFYLLATIASLIAPFIWAKIKKQ